MKITHKNIEITVTGDGKFKATVGGVEVTKPSVDAMKKFIDKSEKEAFEAFSGIQPRNYWPKHDKVKIINLIKERSRFSFNKFSFVSDNSGSYAWVYADTPENEKLLNEIQAFEKESECLASVRIAELEKMKKGLVIIRADEVAEKLGRK